MSRGESRITDQTLGDILIEKANEGVEVFIMIWQEMSTKYYLPSVMGTHCQETYDFFIGTGVNCVLAPRYVLM